MEREQLLTYARHAAERAYVPYSGFRVGAAVVVADGDGAHVVTGANVENASYGLTLCAERSALAAALTSDQIQGHAVPTPRPAGTYERSRITHVAIACLDAPPHTGPEQRTPCGACRQWLAELAPDATYYIDGLPGVYHLDDLLPLAFRLDSPSQGEP
jgi:cytidine deaminase